MALSVFRCRCKVLLAECCIRICRINRDLTGLVLVLDRCRCNAVNAQCTVAIVLDLYSHRCAVVAYRPPLGCCVVSNVLSDLVSVGSGLCVLDLSKRYLLLTCSSGCVLNRRGCAFAFRHRSFTDLGKCELECVALSVFCCGCKVLLAKCCSFCRRIDLNRCGCISIANSGFADALYTQIAISIILNYNCYSSRCSGCCPAISRICFGDRVSVCAGFLISDFTERDSLLTSFTFCIAYCFSLVLRQRCAIGNCRYSEAECLTGFRVCSCCYILLSEYCFCRVNYQRSRCVSICDLVVICVCNTWYEFSVLLFKCHSNTDIARLFNISRKC